MANISFKGSTRQRILDITPTISFLLNLSQQRLVVKSYQPKLESIVGLPCSDKSYFLLVPIFSPAKTAPITFRRRNMIVMNGIAYI
jgi:hypothetical protein